MPLKINPTLFSYCRSKAEERASVSGRARHFLEKSMIKLEIATITVFRNLSPKSGAISALTIGVGQQSFHALEEKLN